MTELAPTPIPMYSLRVSGDEYVLYDGRPTDPLVPGKKRKRKSKRGRLSNAPEWLQVIISTAILRDEKEPYWVVLDKNLHMIEFLRL